MVVSDVPESLNSSQSLAVGHSEVEGLSRITTVVPGRDESIGNLVKQLYKLGDLHELTGDLHKMVALQRLLEPYGICEFSSIGFLIAIWIEEEEQSGSGTMAIEVDDVDSSWDIFGEGPTLDLTASLILM